MTTEQKAKRYDEALKRATKVHKYSSDPAEIKRIEQIFPELIESEDERIRKALTEMVHDTTGDELWIDYNVHKEDAIAWLEKQCKQKSTDEVEPKFHQGDWVIVSTTDGDKVVQIDSVEYFKDGHPRYITTGGRWFGNGTKARLLTDVKNIILSESKAIRYKSWSEEDERVIGIIKIALEHPYDMEGKWDRKLTLDWLKSIKERYTWKPSEEQIKVCKEVYADILSAKGFDLCTINSELNKLEEQLKKL